MINSADIQTNESHSVRPADVCRVYAITCLSTGDRYVGTSKRVLSRWRHHLTTLRKSRHPNRPMQYLWDRYGAEAFRFDVIERVFSDQHVCGIGRKDPLLLEREAFWAYELDATLSPSEKWNGGHRMIPAAVRLTAGKNPKLVPARFRELYTLATAANVRGVWPLKPLTLERLERLRND